tara:strand:+ start:32 stop:214 length:183 start_codon:yes stop_codon:yes gene_type:complete
MKAKLDKLLDKRISKKLSVFIVATVLIALGQLTSGDWVTISVVYIGTQGVIDAVSKLRQK